MHNPLPELLDEYQEILTSQRFVRRDLDPAVLQRHIDLLEQLDVISSSCISIFDLSSNKHPYHSPSFAGALGYDMDRVAEEDVGYINSRVHPDDLVELVRNGIEILRFSLALPIEQRRDVKLINEYRMRKGDGSFVRVLEQVQALELDRRGNIWLALSLIDIAPDQDLATPVRSTMVNFVTGDILQPADDIAPKSHRLSRREVEILQLISDGLPSKEIARKLFISVHTVNTHRQRILEKLDVDNSFEAIRYAGRLGLVG